MSFLTKDMLWELKIVATEGPGTKDNEWAEYIIDTVETRSKHSWKIVKKNEGD